MRLLFRLRSICSVGVAVIALAGFGAARSASADPVKKQTFRVVVAPGSNITLDGDSTLHRWSSKSQTLRSSGMAELAAPTNGVPVEILRVGRLAELDVRIPVTTLKSGNGGLDGNMYVALKAKAHPEIVFVLDGYEVSGPSSAGEYKLKASGKLTVAGRTRAVTLTGTARPESSALRVRGGTEIRMTDFGVKPPTFFLGAMRTDDKVLVRFDVVLKLAATSPSNASQSDARSPETQTQAVPEVKRSES